MTDDAVFPTVSAPILPLEELFAAVQVVTNEGNGELITGLDYWRQPTGQDSLVKFDENLAAEVMKQPPSKAGFAKLPSLWTSLHFALALPALRIALDKYGVDERTRDILLSNADAQKYFPVFPHIEKHYAEYQSFRAQYGEQSSTWWDETLETAFQGAGADSQILPLLASLPAFLRDRATLVLLNQEDSLIGRLVLANLADRDVPLNALRFDPRSKSYLSSVGGAVAKTLYERLRDTELRLGELRQYLESHQPGQPIRLGALAKTAIWFSTGERPGKRAVVETILPGLVGAAAHVATGLLQLITDIVGRGGPDYSKPKLEELPGRGRKFREEHSLLQIGRLSLIKDILYLDEGPRSDGAALRRLASRLYTEEARKKDWGNVTRYLPNPRLFDTFKQDVGNILYSAGLLESKSKENTLAEKLKALAWETKAAHSREQLRLTVRSGSDTINQLADVWRKRYPDSERLLLARFVQLSFGLISLTPIPIALEEINRGFAGSNYDWRQGIYHLRYQEAGDERPLDIPLSVGRATQKRTKARAVYHTIEEGQPPRVTGEGISFSAWFEIASERFSKPALIPMPGRLSVDPFGQTGSAHAGEIVGYGCSVHHASLSVILVEFACLGARRETLTWMMEWFASFNPHMHHRKELARFQLEQTIAAVEQGKELSLSGYLRNNRHLVDDSDRQHLRRCLDGDRQWLEWAEIRLAQLCLGFPHLYPFNHSSELNPRSSWYDGRNVELDPASMSWACVVGANVGVPIADGPKTTLSPLQLSDPQVLICQ